MIELLLVFSLGFLVAALIWLMALPVLWRRAVRLTTRRLEQSLPISANEIEAEHDRLRAEHAVAIARAIEGAEAARRDLVAVKAEMGERLRQEAALHAAIAAGRLEIAACEARIGALKAEIEARDATIETVNEARDIAHATIADLEAQRDMLAGRLDAATTLAENRRLALDEARVLGDRAREAHAEEARRNTQLRQQLQARQAALRAAERRLEDIDNNAVLARRRAGEGTEPVVLAVVEGEQANRQRQAG
jgi:chromosome segregation ATPase